MNVSAFGHGRSCQSHDYRAIPFVLTERSSSGLREGPTVQWSGLQSNLEHAESDTLILLDCCSAASSISGDGSGVSEIIAACGFETWAPGVGDHSFTRSLIDELRYWSRHQKLSVAILHQKVLSRIKHWKPRFGTTGEHEQRKTPIYVVLSNEGKQRSIDLSPLLPRIRPPVELATISEDHPYDSSSSSSESPPNSDEQATASSHSSLDHVWPDMEFESPKALISVALEEDQWLQTDDWLRWLRSIPALVKHTRVEGVFKSGSTMILLSLPVAVWDLLPQEPAIHFIGFIQSNNLLSGGHSRQSTSQYSIACLSDQTDTIDLTKELEMCHRNYQAKISHIEARMKEADDAYREKIELIENDYQSAVHYVKGTEKMLKRMKDELTKYKRQKERLQTSLDAANSFRPKILKGPRNLTISDIAGSVTKGHTLDVLNNYTTIFIVDDSTSMQPLWLETIGILEACICQLDVSDSDGGYSIDLMNGEKGIQTITDLNPLRAIVLSGENLTYQLLCGHLDAYKDSLSRLSLNERQSHAGLNLITLTGSIPSRPFMAIKDLLEEAQIDLGNLGLTEHKVGIQFVRIGNRDSTNSFFQDLEKEYISTHNQESAVSDFATC